jgi:quinol monooxygenase YgiN
MTKVAMLVRIEVHEGRVDDLLRVFDEWFAQFHQEDGTELYALNRDTENPNVFWCYEVYRDDEALQTHLSSEVLRRTLPNYRPLVASQQVIKLEPVDAKGLVSPIAPAR